MSSKSPDERSPLVAVSSAPLYTQEPEALKLSPADTTFSNEARYVVTNSIPVLLTFVFQYLFQIMIPIYFSSRLGETYLSACSLSLTTFYVTGPVVVNGFSTSMDTLCSTAFGAGSYSKVGLYYQRCTVILMLILIPSGLFWLNAESAIFMVTRDENLASLCAQYLRVMPFAIPAIVTFECSKRYLQSQNKFSAPTRIIFLAVPVSVALNHLLIPQIGFLAPPLAFVSTYWLIASSLCLYIWFIDGYQCWHYNTTFRQLTSEWAPFFSLGLPGVLMILSEAFAFQVITFLSAKFSSLELASQSIVSTVASFGFQIPFSVGICCSTRLANIIGAKSENYKIAVTVSLFAACFLSVFNFCWMALFRTRLTKLFTNDPELVANASKLFLVVAFNQFLDCINVICAAILRSQGRQRIGSLLSMICYYLIATPFEVLMAFSWNMNVFGLWLGLAVGVGALSLGELAIVLKSNWESIIIKNTDIV
ncbi:hypothetical protein KL918_004576 [Ogataea parapolymorpha]|uniref:Transporter n=1 Tax=Ogataea parapolymorpha (strain ATCC 26012 / BCRC 20466 / JCM 22074 / NRRL Y-7560 / DL-1) TaxID=871575 RepID=W1QKC3_OGAPD|nr:putative transporter [Ogataea parapolymorpha DL-1]ESX03532.1 putative transporter [Ogataea parapolymorpha DL-1]KAG7865334.1 hypothetical protein KL918_004576 [Ogataea parapolymorpha]KAG7873779.1 hypothetical protein KL916_001939 [Ogataea parapolymorpha]